jgi:hypothetical protein
MCKLQRDISSLCKQVLPMIHEHKIDVQGRIVDHEAGNVSLINPGDVFAHPSAPHCSILFPQTDRPSPRAF